MAVFRYSRSQILELRNKPCVCLPRTTRRRLVYFKLYQRHIPTRICFFRRSIKARDAPRRPCLTKIPLYPQRKTRSGRRPPLPSLLLSNVRSLNNKLDEASLLLSRLRPDLAVFTESWLDSTSNNDAVRVDGFLTARRDRKAARGGGIICYVREPCIFTVVCGRDVPALDEAPSEFLALYVKDFHTLLICVYHAFWSDTEADERAISCITDVLDFGFIKFGANLHILLCGDFNDLRHCFSDISRMTCLTPLVNFPTRGTSCLDQIFSNFATDHEPSSLPPVGLSDHCVILWQPASTRSFPSVKKVTTRKITRSKKAVFFRSVAEYDWLALVQDCSNLDEAASLFTSCLYTLYDICFPTRTVRMRSNEPSWMRPSLKVLMDDRDKAFFKRQWRKYFLLRKEVNAHIIHLKKKFIDASVSSKDSKKVWKALRCLGRCPKNSKSPSNNYTAEDFNSFFASNFQRSGSSCTSNVNMTDSFSDPLPVSEVLTFLKKVPNKSSGPDGLPPWVIRDCALVLCPAVTYLFNWSLQESSVPLCFKSANVIPIPKCSSPRYVSDFRPISLLPVLSKVLEKIVTVKFILPVISKRLSNTQFAYVSRPGSGPVSALVYMYHKIVQFLDSSSGAVRLLSVDFSKAFDKLLHSRIISSCTDFQLPLFVINWISNFLSFRQQRVLLDGCVSAWSAVSSGVPQGSVLGPVLFCMATDSLSHVCQNSAIIRYADDFSILHFVRSASEDHLQVEWDNIVSWSESVNLPLNFLKCRVMDFVTKKNLCLPHVSLRDGTFLNCVSSLSFLGVIFTSDMKWNSHVDMIVTRACQRLFILRNLRRSGCSLSLMLKCYYSFIRSVLLYGFPSFCNIPDCLLVKLKRVEKRALRIMGCDPQVSCIADAADSICTKLFKSLVQNDDHLLRGIFSVRNSRFTRSSKFVRPPFAKTKRFSESFIRYGR